MFIGGGALTEASLAIPVIFGRISWLQIEFQTEMRATAGAWVLAIGTAALYAGLVLQNSIIRAHAFEFSLLKGLAIFASPMAGIVEEGIFRRWLMDTLERRKLGKIAQVVCSGLAFGIVHAAWGLPKGNLAQAVSAAISTTILGMMFAVTYLVGKRSLMPCIVGHTLLDLIIEPGLFLSVMSG